MRSVLLVSCLVLPALSFAQGVLTPPPEATAGGTPVPTMKTLDQVEPRIPLRSGATGVVQNVNGGFTINAPGSYYLTGNLTVASGDGIYINADNVTVDLCGYTVASTPDAAPGGSGIACDPLHGYPGTTSNSYYRNLSVRNGHIQGSATPAGSGRWSGAGFRYGIANYGYARIDHVSVSYCSQRAVEAPWGDVADCTVTRCDDGINARQVGNCELTEIGGTGINAAFVFNCSATASAQAGIRAENALNCHGTSASDSGIYATNAVNCYGTSYGKHGIETVNATGCYGSSTKADGIHSEGTASNCYGSGVNGVYAIAANNCWGSGTCGVYAYQAENCYGMTMTGTYGVMASMNALNCVGSVVGTDCNGIGLYAPTALNCYGYTQGTGKGLVADTASNCRGTSVNDTALEVSTNAENCRGIAAGKGIGLKAAIASNSYGSTYNGAQGMLVDGTANCCRAKSGVRGTALQAGIAVACTAESGTIIAGARYNMP